MLGIVVSPSLSDKNGVELSDTSVDTSVKWGFFYLLYLHVVCAGDMQPLPHGDYVPFLGMTIWINCHIFLRTRDRVSLSHAVYTQVM